MGHVLNVGDALMLRSFFEAYFAAGGVMVATSNVAPDDLYASGINREVFLPFLDALRDKCEFFEMRGRHDYRSRAAEAGKMRGTYMLAEDSPSELCPEQLPELKQALSLPGGHAYLPVAVDIECGFGRKMHCKTSWSMSLPAAASVSSSSSSCSSRNVAKFSFDELCRSASGPSEWVGICDFADAITLSDVPEFQLHDEDAARRFMTFVDIVYDKHRFLVITAKCSPQRLFAELIERYGGDSASMAPKASAAPPPAAAEAARKTPAAAAAHDAQANRMKMPGHGLGSGRHGVIFQRPKQLHYSHSGAYVTAAAEAAATAEEDDKPVPKATSVTRTGGRAEFGLGDPDRVMTGVVEEDSDWVEWSATGLKDASLFDLSPSETNVQITDKLLPFKRCASRLVQMLPRSPE